MKKELEKQYNPEKVENSIYKNWLDKKYFHAKREPGKKTYTIVIPPPNITGQLHMGHALDNTLQDVLIRYHRMKGFDTLWVPGTDHASIATEAKIVEMLKKEGLTKADIGREGFLDRAWAWKERYGGRIVEQLKKLGTSCDWDRERFTLDDGCSRAVREVFCRYYERGLIYRGTRMINWCPHCKTSISDAEVEYKEKEGRFWHIKYPLKDGTGFIEIATTRPETLLGDTAVAVNPNDDRYKDIVGKFLILPLVHREIPIIADDYVDMEFGTGAVKITPAHDPNDYEVGKRHNLPEINVFTEDGKIVEDYHSYAGLDIITARKEIEKDLESEGVLTSVEDYTHNVGTCYRCGTSVEPRISDQWFVRMEELAKPAIEAVKNGKTDFVPKRFEKIYFHWLENIKDWCISRQLWWGHRIPAWYCGECGKITVSRDDVKKCEHCGSENVIRDEDTLDTWFSSALWPFSVLGWPDETEDLKHYYPTQTLVTGYDIIPFWVMRMMYSGLENTKHVPFDKVLIHGLVRDAKGRKMSKSLGNGIDPLEVIDKYGADALRLTLITGNAPGNDMRFSDEKVEASRNFCNKIWNAARFILMNIDDEEPSPNIPDNLTLEDKWILSKLNSLSKLVNENFENFELGVALSNIHEFIWDIFCDWYIELAKIRLNSNDNAAKKTVKAVLVYVLSKSMILLHPFMPFITEEIFLALPHRDETVMLSEYPSYSESLVFSSEEDAMERIMTAVKAVRNRRSEMNVAPSKRTEMTIETEFTEVFLHSAVFFKKLAGAADVFVVKNAENTEKTVNVVTDSASIYIPLGELIDFSEEIKRLEKEKEKMNKEVLILSGKLSNNNFIEKAPKDVIEKTEKSLFDAKEKIQRLDDSILLMKENLN